MGDLHRAKGNFAEAEKWYRQSIEIAPDDAQGLIMLGGMFARLGRMADAEGLYRRAIQCTKGFIDEAHYNLGLLLRAVERYEEAIGCFDAALKLDPQYKIASLAKRDVKHAMEVCSRDPATRAD